MDFRCLKNKFIQLLNKRIKPKYLFLFLLVSFGLMIFFVHRQQHSYSLKVLLNNNNNNNDNVIKNHKTIDNNNIDHDFNSVSSDDINPVKESYNVSVSLQDKAIEEMIQHATNVMLNLPSVPYILGGNKNGAPQYQNASCARFPTVYDIKYSNLYWQTLEASNWTLHAMGAYLDVRKLNVHAPSLRIIGMIDRIGPNITSYCQIWFKNQNTPVIIEVTGYHYIWVSKWGNYKNGEWQPYMLNCDIPKSHASKIPESVSIVELPCSNSTINLKVIFDKPTKKEKFAVCVKGMDFPDDDLSIRLIEWVELQYILGASKIFLYQLANHPNTMKVMDYYQHVGKIEVVNTSLPAGLPNEPHIRHAFLKKKMAVKRQTELLPYNDCFYRNMYKYDYIAVVDIDEVIMPKKHANWSELVADLELKSQHSKKGGHSSFVFHNVYFFHNPADQDEAHYPDIPKEYTMLQHVRRTKYNYTKNGYFIKCFHSTEKILTLHNHFPRSCLGGCKSYNVEKDVAQMQHYKPTCFAKKECIEDFKENSILDTSIWKYKHELIQRVNNIVGILQVH